MKKYAITYSDDKYRTQREFLKETAVASSFFDDVRTFGPKDIEPTFAYEAGQRLLMEKGAGYWLWKPYLIKDMFEHMHENDLLFYFDAGCMVNVMGQHRFQQYVEMLINSDSGTIDFELPYKEYQYTFKETFDYFQSPQQIINSNQLMATILAFRKCTHTMNLIDIWYDVARHKPILFTDEGEAYPQHSDFIAHRHDQSVFSVIRKQYGANIIPDETWFPEFVRDGYNYPFWATRFKS